MAKPLKSKDREVCTEAGGSTAPEEGCPAGAGARQAHTVPRPRSSGGGQAGIKVLASVLPHSHLSGNPSGQPLGCRAGEGGQVGATSTNAGPSHVQVYCVAAT